MSDKLYSKVALLLYLAAAIPASRLFSDCIRKTHCRRFQQSTDNTCCIAHLKLYIIKRKSLLQCAWCGDDGVEDATEDATGDRDAACSRAVFAAATAAAVVAVRGDRGRGGTCMGLLLLLIAASSLPYADVRITRNKAINQSTGLTMYKCAPVVGNRSHTDHKRKLRINTFLFHLLYHLQILDELQLQSLQLRCLQPHAFNDPSYQ